MHSTRHRDPLISRAQPVTIITPVVDETLRMAGAPSVREQIIDRFMNGQPRIAVVHGSEDHPPNLGAGTGKMTFTTALQKLHCKGVS